MRVGERIWFCSRKEIANAEIPDFKEPKEIITRFNYFTVMPASSRGYSEVMKYGEDIDNTWIAIANANHFHDLFGFVLGRSNLGCKDVFNDDYVSRFVKVGDLFWLDGDKPPFKSEITEDFGYAESATAVVKSVSYVNMSISIILTRNKNKVKK